MPLPTPPLASRRQFVKRAALAAASLPLALRADETAPREPEPVTSGQTPTIHIFSKHLQFLAYEPMAEAAARIGFDGIDLTVRPDGHVAPENVAHDLPQAVSAIRGAGLVADLMTTAVDDAEDPTDKAVLRAAAEAGLSLYRMNWLAYTGDSTLPDQLREQSQRLAALSELSRKLGLVGCYQNHSGTLIGASPWEIWQLLQETDPSHFGIQYDIRHAVVEGGLSWTNGLELALPRIRTIAIKDFKWAFANGRNQIVNTPIGEGTVDFKSYFGLLKANGINAPMSLHLEYDIGGAQWGKRELTCPPEKVFDAMRADLARVRTLWIEA